MFVYIALIASAQLVQPVFLKHVAADYCWWFCPRIERNLTSNNMIQALLRLLTDTTDREAWHAAVHGVARSQTRLSEQQKLTD